MSVSENECSRCFPESLNKGFRQSEFVVRSEILKHTIFTAKSQWIKLSFY